VNLAFDIVLCVLGWGGGGRLVFGGSTEDMVEQHPFFLSFMVSTGGGVGRFVPMVMVMERGDTTGAHGLFYSQFHYLVLCVK
jgi:hypothetical protein